MIMSAKEKTDHAPISTRNAEHYKWGANCDGWHLHKSSSLSVIQELMPPNTSEKPHYHTQTTQVFYILDGSLEIITANGAYKINKLESFTIDSGIPHQVKNSSDTPTAFIVISSPPSHGDRIDIETIKTR